MRGYKWIFLIYQCSGSALIGQQKFFIFDLESEEIYWIGVDGVSYSMPYEVYQDKYLISLADWKEIRFLELSTSKREPAWEK